jgi:hypothetical protein
MSDLRDLLERIVPALQQAGVPFMVAGSFASTVGDDLDYGYIERWLNELDLTDEWVLARQTQVS